MIILRQKIYANQDYEGLNMFQRIAKRNKRNQLARQIKRGKQAANSTLKNDIASANRFANDQLDMLKKSEFNNSDKERGLATKDILNRNQQMVNDAFSNRNKKYDELLEKSSKKKERINQSFVRDNDPDYNVSTITNTYKTPPKVIPASQKTPQTIQGQQEKGMGLGGKIAIGTGIAAAGYGAYRLIKARKDKKKAEEAEQQK